MNDYTSLGFPFEPSGSGSDKFIKAILIVITLLVLFGIYQLYTIQSHSKAQSARFQKPIEIQPNQYLVRGIAGVYSKERLMQLGLWRD